MQQITRGEAGVYYGEVLCKSVDEAYRLYRKDYHKALGKAVHQRLDRLGQRTEYLHSYGFVFTEKIDDSRFDASHRTRCYILSLSGLSYIRTIGCWDYSDIREEEFEDWLDWVYERGGGHLRTLGTRDAAGKTNKRYRRR